MPSQSSINLASSSKRSGRGRRNAKQHPVARLPTCPEEVMLSSPDKNDNELILENIKKLQHLDAQNNISLSFSSTAQGMSSKERRTAKNARFLSPTRNNETKANDNATTSDHPQTEDNARRVKFSLEKNKSKSAKNKADAQQRKLDSKREKLEAAVKRAEEDLMAALVVQEKAEQVVGAALFSKPSSRSQHLHLPVVQRTDHRQDYSDVCVDEGGELSGKIIEQRDDETLVSEVTFQKDYSIGSRSRWSKTTKSSSSSSGGGSRSRFSKPSKNESRSKSSSPKSGSGGSSSRVVYDDSGNPILMPGSMALSTEEIQVLSSGQSVASNNSRRSSSSRSIASRLKQQLHLGRKSSSRKIIVGVDDEDEDEDEDEQGNQSIVSIKSQLIGADGIVSNAAGISTGLPDDSQVVLSKPSFNKPTGASFDNGISKSRSRLYDDSGHSVSMFEPVAPTQQPQQSSRQLVVSSASSVRRSSSSPTSVVSLLKALPLVLNRSNIFKESNHDDTLGAESAPSAETDHDSDEMEETMMIGASLSNISASDMTAAKETQPIGGPKYYIATITKAGQAKIVHSASVSSINAAAEDEVPEEMGYEILEYDLFKKEGECRDENDDDSIDSHHSDESRTQFSAGTGLTEESAQLSTGTGLTGMTGIRSQYTLRTELTEVTGLTGDSDDRSHCTSGTRATEQSYYTYETRMTEATGARSRYTYETGVTGATDDTSCYTYDRTEATDDRSYYTAVTRDTEVSGDSYYSTFT